jgi:hypothetical protein
MVAVKHVYSVQIPSLIAKTVSPLNVYLASMVTLLRMVHALVVLRFNLSTTFARAVLLSTDRAVLHVLMSV